MKKKKWIISTQLNDTIAFPQDSRHTLVYISTLCILPMSSQNIKNTCTQGLIFNKVDDFHRIIHGILK